MTLLAMLGSMSSLVSGIGTGFSAAGKLAMDALGGLWDFFNDYFIQPAKDFFSWLGEIWDSIVDLAGDAWEVIGVLWNEFIVVPIQFLGIVFTELIDGINTAFADLWEGAGNLWDKWIATPTSNFFDWLGETLDSVGTWFSELWEGAGNLWNEYITIPAENFFGWLDGTLDSVGSWFSDLWSSAGEFFNDYLVVPIEFFGLVFKALIESLNNLMADLWEGAGSAWETYVSTPISTFFGWLEDTVDSIGGWFSDTWSSISDFEWSDLLPEWSWSDIIPESLSEFFTMDNLEKVWDSITSMFEVVFSPFRDVINDYLIDTINDITGYNFPLGIGSLRDLTGLGKIPYLAQGGIVTGPTLAMIGDNPSGKEAVIPLEKAGEMGFGGKGGNTFNITVNAGGITDRTDKRSLAREIGNMIQQEMARNIGGATMRGRY